MTSSSRRQREIERTRVEILEGAARAILRHGYAATTMQDIAAEADYTAASLYTYFKNKDDIVHAFEEHLRAEVFAAFEAPMPSGLSFRQQIEGLHERGWLRYETTHNLDQIRLKQGLSAFEFLNAYYENREPCEDVKSLNGGIF